MKVLITVPRLDLPGGVANYYKILRPHLPSDKEYFEVGNKSGEKGFFNTFSRFFTDYRKFHIKLSKGDYRLVHVNPSLGPKSVIRDGLIILIAKLHKKKVLVFFRGWDLGCERVIKRYFLPLFQLIYGKADGFIVLANEFKQKLELMGCHSSVFVETTVVEDSIFSNTCSRNNNNAEDKEFLTILFLSRIEKEKGIYEAIQAFATLKQKYPHTLLKIAGDGPEYKKAKAFAQQQKISDIEFLGFVENKIKEQVFTNADIYLFPSSYGEGMPTSVLEAMAYGLPVITRPISGLRDFFEDGRMGYITDSLNSAVFADLLEKLIVDRTLRNEMGCYNQNYARQRFSASKVAARLQRIYEKLI